LRAILILLLSSFLSGNFSSEYIEVTGKFEGKSRYPDIEVIEYFYPDGDSRDKKPYILTNIEKIYRKSQDSRDNELNKSKINEDKKTVEHSTKNREINITKKQEYKDKKVDRERQRVKKSYPKLVIIIDDVTFKYQLDAIKSLPYKVTPSIFPPNRMNFNSYKLARGLKHFLVHLPLESHSKKMNKMYKTIFIDDSYEKVKNRVLEIRKLFPNAKYINNHTGSKFTENYEASKRLYKLLLDNNFTFIDSKTSQRSKIGRISREYNKRYIQCNIFIDNKKDINYTLDRIKDGVQIAKRRGFAVIIGHPHTTTIEALRKAKDILKDVEVIYIDEL
jgi:polysaccharide deacetylase 2 family uncharacterized protein YibQ